jgi:hypothetical protein
VVYVYEVLKLDKIIRDIVKAVPEVKKHLSTKARYYLHTPEAYKSEDFFLAQVEGLVRSLYGNFIGGEFIDTMANLISGQIRDAYEKAYFDAGYEGELPGYLETSYQDFVLEQYNFVDRFFRDIIDARIDGKPIDSLINRARLWAGRWKEAYQKAVVLITQNEGGNMEWVYGDAEHCDTCQKLNGIVASAREWGASGFQPQGRMLDCKGYDCKCELKPTKKRRSPKALDRIIAISLDRK